MYIKSILSNSFLNWNRILKKGRSLLIPCSLSYTHMLLFSASFSTCKLIIDSETHKKELPFFSSWRGFLKTKFISALLIAVNLLSFGTIHYCFVYLRLHRTCLWCISALKEEKNMNELQFIFAKPPFTDFFLSQNFYVYSKIASCALFGDLGTSLLLCLSLLCSLLCTSFHLWFCFANLR